MGNTQLRIISPAVFIFLTKATFAAGLTSFVGVGLGNTSANIPGASGQMAASSSGYRLIAGNQIGQYLAVEAEYVDLGELTASSAKVAAKGLGIFGVLAIPMTNMFSAYGRAGLARIETIVTPLPGAATTLASDSVVGLSLGYGVQLDVSPNASLRLAWDRYKCSTLAASFTDRIDMNSSALLIFRF